MKETRENTMKREQRDRQDEKHVHSVLYFLLGVLLSISLVAVGIAYVLPKMTVRKEPVVTVTSELVEDTINSSLGNYLSANKIAVSEESMEEIIQYISESASNQAELTENQISEVKNLIEVSIQNTNETIDAGIQGTNDNLNNSVVNMQEFVVNGDDEISSALKDYVDNYVVPGITASLEMNSEDIVTVNQNIVKMGNEYDSYKEVNDTNLAEIINLIEEYHTETEENFENTQEKMESYQEELTEKISTFQAEYNAYVESTDNKIELVEKKLDEYVTIAEFTKFKESFESYKANTKDTLEEIQRAVALLEEKKADKAAVEELADNLNGLKTAYDTFTGENGSFSALKERVTTTEMGIVQNSSDIVMLENRITELEKELTAADNANSNSISELEQKMDTADTALNDKLSKFYQVGSVYMTFGNENPGDLFGGSWERVEDTFLMAAGSQHLAGSEGGSNTVTLGAENIPSLNITGKTTAKNGVGTSANGAYNGTVTSSGTYQGGTYGTSANGEHSHDFSAGGTALVVDSVNNHPQMPYADGFAVTRNIDSWWCNHNKINSNIASAGNHSHTISIPSQTITSKGNLSMENHSHTVNIPALNLTGTYQNNNVQSIDVTNKYITVNVWKRVA